MKDEKINRLLKWADGQTAPPFTLDISPTDKCNLRCLSCWQRRFDTIDSNYELSDAKLLEVVNEGIGMGVEEFEITGGGEPLMRRKIVIEMMELIKSNDKFGNITTNGTLFRRQDIEKIVDINWDQITFSLDGPDSKTNNYLRGDESFEKVMSAISTFNELKAPKSSYPKLKFNCVLSNVNYDKIGEIIELASANNVGIVSFEPLTVHSSIGEKLKLGRDEIEKLKSTIINSIELAKKYNIITNLDGLRNESFIEKSNQMDDVILENNKEKIRRFHSILCYEPWWHIVVKVDGSVQPCCLYDLKDENVRNNSLEYIWFGETFQKIRKNILDRNLSEYCSICNAGQVMENIKISNLLSGV